MLDTLLAEHPDAIAIAPADPTALIAPLKKWADAKIPIVTYDGFLTDPPFPLVSEIASANFDGGKLAGDAMGKLIGGKGKVAIIDLAAGAKVLNDLTFALKLSHRRIRERQNKKLDGLKGVEALRELVLDNLPLDKERELETRLEVGYWARSLTRPEVRKVQGMEAAVLHKRMVALIIEAQRRGDMDGTAASTIAEQLLALIDGLSLHALLYPERLSPQAQMTIIDQEFVKLGRRSTAA